MKVWYDEFTLRIADRLRRNIDRGIARSRFGLVVLSPAFLAKNWTQYELDGLVTMSVDGRQILIPLWHGVSNDEVVSFSPSLADRVALTTATSTIEEIADEIAAVILGDPINDNTPAGGWGHRSSGRLSVVMGDVRYGRLLGAPHEYPSIWSLGAWPFIGEPRGSLAAQSFAATCTYVPG